MRAPCLDIAEILIAESFATVLGTDIFVADEPDNPVKCITIYDTGGYEPDYNYTYDRPTVQVKMREQKGKYPELYVKALAIRDKLLTKQGYITVANDTKYIGIWIQSDIFFLGNNQNNQPEIVINFRLHRTDK